MGGAGADPQEAIGQESTLRKGLAAALSDPRTKLGEFVSSEMKASTRRKAFKDWSVRFGFLAREGRSHDPLGTPEGGLHPVARTVRRDRLLEPERGDGPGRQGEDQLQGPLALFGLPDHGPGSHGG